MKIAVYSGSFNPLHIGHKAIIEYLTRELDFDEVYLIVSPQNPLKEPCSNDISGKDRLEAARKAVARHGLKAKVDDIEINMPAPHYTIRTLDALKAREPENSFTLAIGADNLDRMRYWKDYRRILTEYGVLVYPRTGYNMESLRSSLMEESENSGTIGGDSASGYKIQLAADAPIVNISSTEIRHGLAEGLDMSRYQL